jgi:hypothetical protein
MNTPFYKAPLLVGDIFLDESYNFFISVVGAENYERKIIYSFFEADA